jgi:hypothetical protein
MKEGEGLVAYTRRASESNIKKSTLEEILNYVFVTAPKIKKEYEKEKRKLWNKHYKRYNLKFRDEE